MIIESADVFDTIHAGMPYAIALLGSYTILYCISYSLLFSVLGLPIWTVFIPFYGQAILFKRFGKSPWLVLLPLIPVIGIFYILERLGLRMRIAKRLKVFCLLRPFVWVLPITSNTLLYLIWRYHNANLHKERELGEAEK